MREALLRKYNVFRVHVVGGAKSTQARRQLGPLTWLVADSCILVISYFGELNTSVTLKSIFCFLNIIR